MTWINIVLLFALLAVSMVQAATVRYPGFHKGFLGIGLTLPVKMYFQNQMLTICFSNRIARDAQQEDAENSFWWCDPNQVACYQLQIWSDRGFVHLLLGF